MGNFCNNTNDLVHLEVDYMTSLTLATTATTLATDGSNATTYVNMYDSIEVFTDFPQQDSYDATSQTNTYHICTLDREGLASTKKYTDTATDI